MRWFGLIALILLLAACGEPGDQARQGATPAAEDAVRVADAMGGDAAPGFARATTIREFRFPEDHGPHPEFGTEWWYFTGNLDGPEGRRFGFQVTLFRVGLDAQPVAADSYWRANTVYMGHLAVTDIDGGQHYSAERFARAALGLAGAETRPLNVWLESWSIEGGESGDTAFPLRVRADGEGFGLDLVLQRGERPVVLQGEQGLSRKSAEPGNASYYYSLTRLPASGTVTLGARAYPVSGDAWLDREWSTSALGPDQAGWDWFALQLDDGRELMFYRLRTHAGGMHAFSRGSLLDAQGVRHAITPEMVELEALGDWSGPEGARYPVEWRLRIPEQGLDLTVAAAVDAQLMAHTVRYWEGAVDVSGSATGRGYLELAGY